MSLTFNNNVIVVNSKFNKICLPQPHAQHKDSKLFSWVKTELLFVFYLQFLGQLLGDALQEGDGGFLSSQKDELNISVPTQQQAFGQDAHPHHPF